MAPYCNQLHSSSTSPIFCTCPAWLLSTPTLLYTRSLACPTLSELHRMYGNEKKTTPTVPQLFTFVTGWLAFSYLPWSSNSTSAAPTVRWALCFWTVPPLTDPTLDVWSWQSQLQSIHYHWPFGPRGRHPFTAYLPVQWTDQWPIIHARVSWNYQDLRSVF